MKKRLLIPLYNGATFEHYINELDNLSGSLLEIYQNEGIEEAIISVSDNSTLPILPGFEGLVREINKIFSYSYIKQQNSRVLGRPYFQNLFDSCMYEIYRTDAQLIISGEIKLSTNKSSSILLNNPAMNVFKSHYGTLDRTLDFFFNECKIGKVLGWGMEGGGYTGKFKIPGGSSYEVANSYVESFPAINPKTFKIFRSENGLDLFEQSNNSKHSDVRTLNKDYSEIKNTKKQKAIEIY